VDLSRSGKQRICVTRSTNVPEPLQVRTARCSSKDTFENARYYIAGNSGETIAGTAHGDDVLVGGQGADRFVQNGPNSVLDGRLGTDTAVYTKSASRYSQTQNPDGSWTITDLDSGSTQTLKNIEQLQFSDGVVAVGSAPPARSSFSLGSAPAGWSISDAADLTGDGRDDILWHNAQTGQAYVWDLV
jgi:hypothetical protein